MYKKYCLLRAKHKIICYEEKDFQGKSYECTGHADDLQCFISRCNSFKVERGRWVLYEFKSYTGRQMLLGPSVFKDFGLGFNFRFESCKVVKNTKGPYKQKLFAYAGFQGKSMELTEDMISTQEKWPSQKVMSCKVLEGSWIFFEEPNYSGCYYVLDRGDYQYSPDWGSQGSTVGSIRRIMEL
ncbi:gamma-crystallin 2-like [Acanthopagrus latus]|uniref:gamma-crystallin 2-like n=1 Tax=Acanthopagrus latus TaxID=8177 RepID=UPI00187CD1EA|nr:gamma-crystallin 2-like [Acanthopagrus latus]